MSVVSTAPSTTATGNGATTAFPFAFACRSVSDVAVYVNGVLQNSGYTVVLNSGFNGGTVTFATAPANLAAIILASNPPFTQLIAFENAGPYNPLTVDGMADAAAIRDIYLNGQFARALLAPLGDTLGLLPTKTARAGLFFGFDGSGNPVALNPGGADSALRTDLVASTGSSLVNFLQSGGGAVARTLQSKGRDFISTKDFACVGDGSTDDTAGITAAEAIVGRKYVPAGTFKTTIGPTVFRGPYWGSGQIKDSANNLRGKWFSAIAAAPASLGNDNSVETAFNGDLAKVQIAMEHRITGTATLTQPLSGYVYTNEAYPFVGYLYNSSGWNNGTGDNTGRTAACFHRVKVFQAGQGDAVAYNFSGIITSFKVGATHFLANPGVCGFNGDLTAGVAGAYLNPFETSLSDAGFDVAGVGYVANLNRTNATGALSAYWAGVRIQSIGTVAVDSIVSAFGKFNAGCDFTACNFGANQAAIVLVRGQRVYGNAATTDPDGLKFTSLGLDYFVNSASGWDFYVGGNLVMRAGAVTWQMATSTVAGLPAAGTVGRKAFVTDATATTFASIVAGSGANKVPVYDDGTNWRIG